MPRHKYQRPEVYFWKGKSGQKFWKAEWRQYIEGRPKPKHRAATWLCKDYSKAEAQEECDRLIREETGGVLRPDGSLTVAEFWEKVYFPTASRRLAPNSKMAYESSWRVHIKPTLDTVELQHVTKHAVSTVLDKMADAGKSKQTVQIAFVVMNEILAEALENGYIAKNPAYHVTLPICTAPKETRPLDEAEVRRLFEKTSGRDRLMWRILLLTGMRPGELLALQKSDLVPAGLRIDESAFKGKAGRTKNGKIRYAPIPESLRQEIEQWAAGVEGDVLFPNGRGHLYQRYSQTMQEMLKDSRKAAEIPDLTFRMCRTTFATLYDGDLSDAQAILGHSTMDLTMRVYRKPVAARQQASVEEMDARFCGKVVTIGKKERTA